MLTLKFSARFACHTTLTDVIKKVPKLPCMKEPEAEAQRLFRGWGGKWQGSWSEDKFHTPTTLLNTCSCRKKDVVNSAFFITISGWSNLGQNLKLLVLDYRTSQFKVSEKFRGLVGPTMYTWWRDLRLKCCFHTAFVLSCFTCGLPGRW